MENLTEKDLVSFGLYLLSKERRELYASHPMFPDGIILEERLSQVSHSDLENWKVTRK